MEPTAPTADRKLRGAKFFLDRLKEVRRHPRAEEFGFYLSALLGEARSVTWGLQNDLGKDHADARLAMWRAARPADLGFLDFMNEQRVDEVHRKGAAIETQGRSVQLGFAIQAPDGRFIPVESPFGPGTVAYGLAAEHYFEIDGQPVEVIAACERYITLLESIVEECKRCGNG
jgi:hypothetical protein